MTGSEPWHCAVGLCFPVLPVYRATVGDSAVPMGSRTYSFRGLAVMSVLFMSFFLFHEFYVVLILVILFVLLNLMSRSALMLRLRITAWF